MDSACVAFLGVLVTLVCWFCAQRAWRFSLFKRLGIPGPSPSFIYGNLEELLGKAKKADLLQILLNAESEDSAQINFEPVKEGKPGDRKVHLTCRTRTLANATLFIIAAFVQRACDEDYEYKGMRFPKDTVIGVPVLRMHYDPKFWSEPEKFDPDRFSSENKHKITPMAYLPFGAGPRNCIASRYSELIMRVTLATLVSRHKLTPSEGEPKTTGNFRASFILLVPDKGIWLRTEKLSTA
ncbi:hypothetical protein V5799_032282 [Amblyomma americanum]|uniref:Cytochrome n=1 Tax=Amblyomma americanum TaxID=6943 RepID=A0AAQ4DRL8_AMBAM